MDGHITDYHKWTLARADPERMHSCVRNGTAHTFLLGDTRLTAGAVTVLDWVTSMLAGSADWISTSD